MRVFPRLERVSRVICRARTAYRPLLLRLATKGSAFVMGRAGTRSASAVGAPSVAQRNRLGADEGRGAAGGFVRERGGRARRGAFARLRPVCWAGWRGVVARRFCRLPAFRPMAKPPLVKGTAREHRSAAGARSAAPAVPETSAVSQARAPRGACAQGDRPGCSTEPLAALWPKRAGTASGQTHATTNSVIREGARAPINPPCASPRS